MNAIKFVQAIQQVAHLASMGKKDKDASQEVPPPAPETNKN